MPSIYNRELAFQNIDKNRCWRKLHDKYEKKYGLSYMHFIELIGEREIDITKHDWYIFKFLAIYSITNEKDKNSDLHY